MFSAQALRHRMQAELGPHWEGTRHFLPPFENKSVTEQNCPLGVLLHIAAGNADGLPAFSVLEGLLTGNVNILKLPAAEGGLSVRLLWELIQIDPGLADYIYVFDYSSKDIFHMEKLIDVADGIVVWGGEQAVSAFRGMIKPHIKLIEWGHKISFSYVTKAGMTNEGMMKIAGNIAETGQLLCSSCQGIFLDTDSMDDIFDFCEAFLPVLDHVIKEKHGTMDMGVQAQSALQVYCAQLESMYTGARIFKGENGSLTALNNPVLETSLQFGNAWVKPLPRKDLLKAIRPYKNFLQTVGLLCNDSERDEITNILFKTGVVRICLPDKMSETYCGAAHDGEYPLRRYTKVTSIS